MIAITQRKTAVSGREHTSALVMQFISSGWTEMLIRSITSGWRRATLGLTHTHTHNGEKQKRQIRRSETVEKSRIESRVLLHDLSSVGLQVAKIRVMFPFPFPRPVSHSQPGNTGLGSH